MKIIRHGYFGNDAFVCRNCGCVFQVDEPEDTAQTLFELCKFLFPNCPDCGEECIKRTINQVTNKEQGHEDSQAW